MGPISKIRLYLRHFRERDDVLKVWVVFIYGTSLPHKKVLFYRYREGGYLLHFLKRKCFKIMSIKLNRQFAIFVPWSFLVVIMGTCTQAVDTVFLF